MNRKVCFTFVPNTPKSIGFFKIAHGIYQKNWNVFGKSSLKYPKSFRFLLSNQKTARALRKLSRQLVITRLMSCCLATSRPKTAGSVDSLRRDSDLIRYLFSENNFWVRMLRANRRDRMRKKLTYLLPMIRPSRLVFLLPRASPSIFARPFFSRSLSSINARWCTRESRTRS